ncbi:MAG TPA: hypothetical protein PLJ29_06590 [Leptospiraceae bacterium]|nr:hypothetical protein [Leptospiraceae bacterium]
MSKKIKFTIIIGMILFSAIGCVQLQSVTINSQPSPEERKTKISAESDKLVFLAFNFNNDFLEETPKKLLDQCKDGKIRGIISKFETVHYFIFIRYVVKASGYCIK